MTTLIVNGGKPISGVYTPTGNKNAALPALAACLLTDQPVILHNVPLIKDVEVMLLLLESLGVSVMRDGHSVTLCAANIKSIPLDRELCRRVRASILLAGPLVARTGRAEFFPPGGDVIGRRRLDTHFYGLKALGVSIAAGTSSYVFKQKKLTGAAMLLDEASVTATENILMTAALAQGETTIYNAACEPHVQDLSHLLVAMGVSIDGIGTNYLRIRGRKKLRGAEFTIGPDYIEVGSFMAASLVTGGELTIRNMTDSDAMEVVRRAFSKIGANWTMRGKTLTLPARKRMKIINDFGSAIPKIEDGIWPAFPSDLMSVAIVLATQSRGSVLFFEKLFESRMYFVDRLIEMGARIVQCDPHRVLVQGPSRLHGIHMSSPDIRAGMSMLIAALAAKGTSRIDNAEVIDRGYEAIEERLKALGADITREG